MKGNKKECWGMERFGSEKRQETKNLAEKLNHKVIGKTRKKNTHKGMCVGGGVKIFE